MLPYPYKTIYKEVSMKFTKEEKQAFVKNYQNGETVPVNL